MKILLKGVLLLILMLSLPAQALTLNEARAQGRVGEMLNGYLGAVKQDPETLELVTKINTSRAQVYQQLADKNQITREDVARLAGQKLVNKAGRGEYVRGLNGQWLKKE